MTNFTAKVKQPTIYLIRFLLVLSVFILSQSKSYGQKKHYERSSAGVGLIYYQYEGYKIDENSTKGVDSNYVLGNAIPITLYFNSNLPIINIKNNSAIGINPGLTLSANTKTLGASIPVFLTFKFGTDAQIKQKGSKFGFGAGIGYAVGAYASEEYRFLFNKPQLMAEISLQTGRLINKLRLMVAAGEFTSNSKLKEATGGYYTISNYAGVTYSLTFEK